MDVNFEGLSFFDKHVNKSDHGGHVNASNRPILYEEMDYQIDGVIKKDFLFGSNA